MDKILGLSLGKFTIEFTENISIGMLKDFLEQILEKFL